MKIGCGSINRVPAQIVRLTGRAGAFIEIATHFQRFAFVFHTDKVERYYHQQIPGKDALKFAEWTATARTVASDSRNLVVGKAGRGRTLHAVRGVDGADAVEFEIPVLTSRYRFDEEFHTAVFANLDWLVKFSARRKLQRTKKSI